MEPVGQVLGRREVYDMNEVFCCEGILNMTYLALNLSHYVNGVAKRHGEISRLMFSRYVIDAITNGVHAGTWTAKPFEELFDRYISSEIGEIQVLYAGKAHPADQGGKEIIRHVFQISEMLNKQIKVADLENYDMFLSQMITSGVDVWLNTPQPPFEASGTSGMKAALNGVPSLSVLDGWWVEGCIEGVTGWAIGKPWRPTDDGSHNRSQDSVSHPAFLQQSRPVRRCHAPRNSA